jgi:hypothetical protein
MAGMGNSTPWYGTSVRPGTLERVSFDPQRYRIEGSAFVYADDDNGRVTTILGYPTDQLGQVS